MIYIQTEGREMRLITELEHKLATSEEYLSRATKMQQSHYEGLEYIQAYLGIKTVHASSEFIIKEFERRKQERGKFMECDTCQDHPAELALKELCKGCLHNRRVIDQKLF
jgi:hypothetical protein